MFGDIYIREPGLTYDYNCCIAMMGGYATASLSREGTPKKSNFEKTMSLVDISVDDDMGGLSIAVPTIQSRERRNTANDLETSRSDPGNLTKAAVTLINPRV